MKVQVGQVWQYKDDECTEVYFIISVSGHYVRGRRFRDTHVFSLSLGEISEEKFWSEVTGAALEELKAECL